MKLRIRFYRLSVSSLFVTLLIITMVNAYEPALVLEKVSVFQSHGASENNLLVNHEVSVKGSFVSLASEKDTIRITYIVLIKDDDGFTVSLTWAEKMLVKGDLTALLTWVPERTGNYTIDVFAWDDLDTPTPITGTLSLLANVLND